MKKVIDEKAPRRLPREGWNKAFENVKKEEIETELLIGDFANEFDAEEWTWPVEELSDEELRA